MTPEYRDFSSLPVRELLRLILREKPGSSAVEELTVRFGSLRDLAGATFAELTEIKGIGPGKAAALLAAIELARRLCAGPPEERPAIKSPQDVAGLVMGEMRHLDREHFRAILLDAKNRALKVETVSVGTLNTSFIHPREVFKSAVKNSAAAIILVHNHPSGDPAPSEEDIRVTRRLVEAGLLLGIEVLDHVVIGDGRFVGFREKGLL